MTSDNHSLVPQKSLGHNLQTMRGAAGKAFMVWLMGGSVGTALIAYLIFRAMGC